MNGSKAAQAAIVSRSAIAQTFPFTRKKQMLQLPLATISKLMRRHLCGLPHTFAYAQLLQLCPQLIQTMLL